jgi:hypothetical protein
MYNRRKLYEFRQTTGSPIADEAPRPFTEFQAVEKNSCGNLHLPSGWFLRHPSVFGGIIATHLFVTMSSLSMSSQ